jgi:hypothetical protein
MVLKTIAMCACVLLIASQQRLSSRERQVVGAWSWTYIEGVGRIIFTADHKVRKGFPPDDKDGRRIGDDEFDIVWAGPWRLEDDVLITEMDNRPLLKIMERLDPNSRPRLERKVERRKLVQIDANKMIFDNLQSLDRALIVGQAPGLAQDKREEGKKRIWGASYSSELVGDDKDRRLQFFDISQGPEHLVGSCVLTRQKEGSPQLVIQGHLNSSGEFTANVSFAVSDREDGNWEIIESSLSDEVDVTLTGAPHIDKLYIRLHFDPFQPYIEKFKFCRVTLQTGETDVFPMAWLTEKGQE